MEALQRNLKVHHSHLETLLKLTAGNTTNEPNGKSEISNNNVIGLFALLL